MTRHFREIHLAKLRRLTAGLSHHLLPSLSPDARLVAHTVMDGQDAHLALTDRKGRIARVISGPVSGRASISCDGTVAFTRLVGATCEIWSLADGDSEPRRLLGGDGRLYREPTFSPDGTKLAFLADDGGGAAQLRLWVHDRTSDHKEALLHEIPDQPDARLLQAVWSPFGDSVFVTAQTRDGDAVFEVSASGGQVVQRSPFGCSSPAPLVPGLLCVAHRSAEQDSELLLLACPPCADKPRQAILLDRKHGADEPAVALDKKGQAIVAFAMPDKPREGEPPRNDVHLAVIAGLPRRFFKRGDATSHADNDTQSDSSSDSSSESQCLGAAQNWPPFHDMWMSMERGA
ncbi:MAG TPA: hypothetical protein PKE31_06135 [Pseudomonadota bacterium]|nr:hypothetical protein [Pseudomonadota bacterium]